MIFQNLFIVFFKKLWQFRPEIIFTSPSETCLLDFFNFLHKGGNQENTWKY